jgi:hypothetical protein
MSLLSIFRSNPIKRLKYDQLKDIELKLKVKSDRLAKEVAEIDAEIQHIFEKSKEITSRLEEINLASRIKTLGQQKDMKVAAHAELEKELRAVTNMLIIKQYEVDLRAAGAWDPLEKIPPEKLEKYLVERKLEAEDRQAAVRVVTELTSTILKPKAEYDEGLEDILAVMKEVKQGKLEPESAGKMVSKDKEVED